MDLPYPNTRSQEAPVPLPTPTHTTILMDRDPSTTHSPFQSVTPPPKIPEPLSIKFPLISAPPLLRFGDDFFLWFSLLTLQLNLLDETSKKLHLLPLLSTEVREALLAYVPLSASSDEFIQTLRYLFRPKETPRELRAAFNNREQEPGESLDEFFVALTRLARTAYPPEGAGAPILEQLVEGVREPGLGFAFAEKPPVSVPEALQRAEKLRAVRTYRQASDPTPTQPSPYRPVHVPPPIPSLPVQAPSPAWTGPWPPQPTAPTQPAWPVPTYPAWSQQWPNSALPPGWATQNYQVAPTRSVPQLPRLKADPDPTRCGYCLRYGKAARHCGHNEPGELAFSLASLKLPRPSDYKPLVIQGALGGEHTSVLVDSGAAVSVIHSSFAKLGKDTPSPIPLVNVTVANNSILRVTGWVEAKVRVGSLEAQHVFLVSPDTKWNVILGCDFLRPRRCVIDFNTEDVRLPSMVDMKRLIDLDAIDLGPPTGPTCIDDILPGNINEQEITILRRTLEPFSDVFTWAGQSIGRTNVVQHTIDVGEAKPQRQPPRRIPFHYRAELDQLISNLLKDGVITTSNSPWAAPVSLVKKKDDSLRLCIDYRKLNAVTVRDSFPLPRMDELLTSLAGMRYFTTLDLSNSYWQIEVYPEDREKTAFVIPSGLFEFTTLPMGLANAAATCQRLMQKVLKGLTPKKCLVYLDDVLIFGATPEEMMTNLEDTLQRYRVAGLTINPKKCCFLQREVNFLGHTISEQGIFTEAGKVSAVQNWPQPESGEEMKSFLGLAGYYRAFIPSYARIAFPLNRLTEKDRPFKWTAECKVAFHQLKEALTAAPILAFPILTSDAPPFVLDTDASSHAIGAVLSQRGEDGRERVISYGSRTLDKAERNYSTTRREMLALVAFTKKFAVYLLGKRFQVRTDHQALTWLKNFREPEGQLARWQEALADYDMEVSYRPGQNHANADALSRVPMREPHHCATCEAVDVNTITLHTATSNWAGAQANDPDVSLLYDRQLHGQRKPTAQEMGGQSREAHALWSFWGLLHLREGVLYFQYDAQSPYRLVLPTSYATTTLTSLHEQLGHAGQGKLERAARQRFWSPNLRRDVALVCNACTTCAQIKGTTRTARAALQPIPSGYPNQRLGVDIMGPFPQSRKGNCYLLVMVDFFTKWAEATALPNQEARTVAEAILGRWITRFGTPDQIHSDQGSNFESRLLHELCTRMGIQKTRTTAYHPQGNGQTERTNRSILNLLRSFVAQASHDIWDDLVPHCLLAYRSTVHQTTGYTPALMMLGRELTLPFDVHFPTPPTNNTEPSTYVAQLVDIHTEAFTLARQHLQAQQVAQARLYDRQAFGSPYQPGDHVWLHQPIPPRGLSRKFHKPWMGPFNVLQCLPHNVYRIQAHGNAAAGILTVHFNRLKPSRQLQPRDTNIVERVWDDAELPVDHTIEIPVEGGTGST